MKPDYDLISYPFLNEDSKVVDHELLTDKLSATLGHILSQNTPLEKETCWLLERVLHLNGSLRGKMAISDTDIKEGLLMYHVLKDRNKGRVINFVYPTGSSVATLYHNARCEAKLVTRNLYLIENSGVIVPQILIDFSNLTANLLFAFAIETNRLENIDEIEFISKSY